MNYSERQPKGLAESYVKLYWELSHKREEILGEPEPVLPDGCVELIFDFEDRFLTYHSAGNAELQPRSIIAGQLTSPMVIGPSGNTDLFGVRLRTEASYSILNLPMSEIRDQIIDLKDVLGNREPELFECLAEAKSIDERIARFENFLFETVERSIDIGVSACVNAIRHSGGTVPITRLSAELGWSVRRIERAFKEQVGIAPKTFARIVRFQSFIGSVSVPNNSILDLALSAGYFDQAHLIKDFRQLAGTTPKEYFSRRAGFSAHFLDI